MNKIFLVLTSFFLLTSCLKDDLPKDYTEKNEQEILEYLAENDLEATKDAYGIYYIIEEEGTGLQPVYDAANGIFDVVTVNYTGSFTNGEVFDEKNDVDVIFSLLNIIDGWKIGIPYFKEGGKGKLIIPSRWAYGSNDYNGIPGGSVLVFDIELHSVNFNKENDEEILEYLEEEGLKENAIKTDSGLYYIIEEKGTGEQPTSTDDVKVVYKGYQTDGETFDESQDEGITFNLQEVIAGWQEGITYFKEGGKGKLFIPSRLAYGNYAVGDIDPGSVLIFDIELVSVNYTKENDEEILEYLEAEGLTENAVKTDSGLYYIIEEEEGTGEQPTNTDNVKVIYKGYYTSGTTFDESDDEGSIINLQEATEGWQEGITYFKEGGKGKLFIPSRLGYDDGTVRIFDVDLKSIEN